MKPDRVLLPASPASRRGFTVLELLVALTLGMVLLSAIWTMFRLFLRHQELESAQMVRAQVVRGLHQLLSQDLRELVPAAAPRGSKFVVQSGGKPRRPRAAGSKSAARPPAGNRNSPATNPAPAPDSTGSPAPAQPLNVPSSAEGSNLFDVATLQGDRQQLTLTVFTHRDDAEFESTQPVTLSRRDSDDDSPLVAPTKQIVYEFVAPQPDEPWLAPRSIADRDEEEKGFPQVGLWRREFLPELWRTATTDTMLETIEAVDGIASPFLPPVPKLRGARLRSAPARLPLSEEFTPEITDLRFDYFDGQSWQGTWNSEANRALPVLVRVRFDVEANPRRRAKDAVEPTASRTSQREQASGEQERRDPPQKKGTKLDRAGHPFLTEGDALQEGPEYDCEFLLLVRGAEPGSKAGQVGRPPQANASGVRPGQGGRGR